MEGLSLPLHPRFNTRSDGNFFPKSCLSCLQQSGPGAEVWQVRSMTEGLFQEGDLLLFKARSEQR